MSVVAAELGDRRSGSGLAAAAVGVVVRCDRLGRPIDLALDANECVGGPALPVGIAEAFADAARYPDRSDLERVIARRTGVDPARIVATAGGDDAIDRVCRTVLRPGSITVLTDPTFPMFRVFAEARGAAIRAVPWLDGPLPVADLVEAGRGADLFAIATPANPTGLEASVEALHEWRASCPDPLLLLDLAYTEFAADTADDFEAVADACRDLPRTVIVRTLSKAWGLAGLRVGWADAAPETAAALRAAGGPYPVSVPSLAVAAAVLSDPASERVVAGRVRSVSIRRDRLAATLESLGVSCGPSRANFLLVGDLEGTGPGRIAWLADGLAATGVAVRRFEEGPIADRVRITVPVGEEAFARTEAAVRATLRPEAVLFDLDGVLADVSRSYRAVIIETVRGFGVEVTAEDVESIKAAGDANDDWEVSRRLLADRGVDVPIATVVERFQSRYLGEADRPGLRETESCPLDPAALAAAVRGRPIGIVTGRPRAEAEWFLARSGLDRVVTALVAREDAPLKPDPTGVLRALDRLDAGSAWFFGDTVDDVVAARAVRDRCVIPIGVRPPGTDPTRAAGLEATLFRAGAARVIDAGPPIIELLQEILS